MSSLERLLQFYVLKRWKSNNSWNFEMTLVTFHMLVTWLTKLMPNDMVIQMQPNAKWYLNCDFSLEIKLNKALINSDVCTGWSVASGGASTRRVDSSIHIFIVACQTVAVGIHNTIIWLCNRNENLIAYILHQWNKIYDNLKAK